MTTSARCPACLPQLRARFTRLLRATEGRYGSRSHAVLLTRFQYLIALHEWVAESGDHDPSAIHGDLAEISGQIVARYAEQTLDDAPPPRDVMPGDPPLLVFDRSYYRQWYAKAGEALAPDVVVVGGGRAGGPPVRADAAAMLAGDQADRADRLRTGAVYLYVLDDRFLLRACCLPITLENQIWQTNPACGDGSVAVHPMLVPERLAAYSAGEIILAGRDRVRAVVANTKSGHFRPPATSASLVRAAIEAAFPDAVLITVLPVVMRQPDAAVAGIRA